jgi:hypothetical protein
MQFILLCNYADVVLFFEVHYVTTQHQSVMNPYVQPKRIMLKVEIFFAAIHDYLESILWGYVSSDVYHGYQTSVH